MDLSAITPSTIKVEIKHPGTGAPTGLVIECASLESEPVKRVQRAITDKVLRSRNRKPTAEQIEENAVEVIAAAVVGWEWKDGATWEGGKKLDFSLANVRTVVSVPWLRQQLDEALGDEAAFFGN